MRGRLASGMEKVETLLYAEDIEGAKAQTAMLADAQMLSRTDASAIMRGLEDIRSEIEAGAFHYRHELQDIHANIAQRLSEKVGEPAQRLQAAHSRNERLATDLRLWAKKQVARIDEQLKLYQQALCKKALRHAGAVMPGLVADSQPITFGHYLMAFVDMAARDRARFQDALNRLDESPVGALAPSRLDRRQAAQLLGFARVMQNSLDAATARDFVAEVLSASAICAMHLSRFAEELSFFALPQIGFLSPDEDNSFFQLYAKTARISGVLSGFFSALRSPAFGPPHSEDDTQKLFDAVSTVSMAIELMTCFVADLAPDAKEMRKAAEARMNGGDEAVGYFLRSLKLSMRQAQALSARLSNKAQARGLPLRSLPLEEMREEHSGITEEIYTILKASACVRSRTQEGGPAPKNVKVQARRWLKNLTAAS